LNKKNISKHLEGALEQWIKTLPLSIQHEVRVNSIITGGSITSLLLSEEVHDYDVYFRDSNVALKVAEFYQAGLANKMRRIYINQRDEEKYVYLDVNSNGFIEILPGPVLGVYKPRFITSNAISLSDKFQLIFRFCGEAPAIHKNFDFIHCTNWYNQGEVHLNPDALTSILAKELNYTGSLYPLASIIRTRKFINRGWLINAGQYLKMCLQLQQLDLSNFDTSKDQLIGVDATYFQMMLSQIKEGEIVNGRVDSSYIISLINKFF